MSPILFNTQMVKAILEGRKTTTRRIVKGNVQDLNVIGSSSSDGVNFNHIAFGYGNIKDINSVDIKERVKAPYLPEDILYVRETWKITTIMDNGYISFGYKTDVEDYKEVKVKMNRYYDLVKYRDKNGWQPSIFMPKEAARIYLKVTEVRAERLKDITDDGIKAEGITEEFPPYAEGKFKELWNNTLKKEEREIYGWNADPWVWVIEFERIYKGDENV